MASYEMAAATITGEDGIATISPAIADVLKDYLGKDDQTLDFNDARDMPTTGGTDAPTIFTAIENAPRAENTFTSADIQTETIVMEEGTAANVTFGADSPVTNIVVGGLGGSRVNFLASKDVTAALQGGFGDRLTTAGGNDNIDFNGGSATINTGDGQDTVTIKGEGEAEINGGSGNMVVYLQTEATTATIDGGDGFDRLEIGSATGREAHSFEIVDGKFVMHSDGAITMENMDVVVFQTDDDPAITDDDQITLLATNVNDSLVGKLYQIAYGREAIDGEDSWVPEGSNIPHPLGGINFWFNVFEQGQTGYNASTEHLVYSFLNTKEFHQAYDTMSNQEYVDALFTNFPTNSATINGKTAAQYVQQLENDHSANARFDVAWEMAASADATKAMGIDGNQYVIDNFDGDIPSA